MQSQRNLSEATYLKQLKEYPCNMKHSCKLQGVTDSHLSYFYCIKFVTKVGSVFFRTLIFRTVYDVMKVSGLRKYRVEGYVTSGECRVVSARRREGGGGELCTQGGGL